MKKNYNAARVASTMRAAWDVALRSADTTGAVMLNAAAYAGSLIALSGGSVERARGLVPDQEGAFFARVRAHLDVALDEGRLAMMPANDNDSKHANRERAWVALKDVCREFPDVDFSIVAAVSRLLAADCDSVDGWLPVSYLRARTRHLFHEQLGVVSLAAHRTAKVRS